MSRRQTLTPSQQVSIAAIQRQAGAIRRCLLDISRAERANGGVGASTEDLVALVLDRLDTVYAVAGALRASRGGDFVDAFAEIMRHVRAGLDNEGRLMLDQARAAAVRPMTSPGAQDVLAF
jgi:hypothetical protein